MGPYLVSEPTAQWLRSEMSPGNTRSRKRQSHHAGGVFDLWHPWKITVAPDPEEEGSFKVSVAKGEVSWGGGENATWPGAEIGSVAEGETRLVVWSTKVSAVPLYNDPRWPTGQGVPKCKAEDCDCRKQHGDPNAGAASPGSVTLEEEGFERPDGATDCRIVGSVSVENGAPTIYQALWSSITVRAIVRDGEEGGEDPEQEPPPCGNPLNREGENDSNPVGGGGGGGGGGGSSTPGADDRERHPLDYPGDGGYTPTCKTGTDEIEY